jgi:membrane associated rhomboid family serine protease
VIAGATTIAFIAQAAAENASRDGAIPLFVARHLALSWDGLLRGEVWQVATHALLHSGIFHLFWNMASLIVLLTVLENRLLPREVYAVYAVGAIGGAAGHVLWVLAGLSPGNTVVVGASGAVTAVFAAAVVLMGRTKLALFGVLSIPVWLLGVIFVGWDAVAAVLYVIDPVTFDTGVAVQAHLGGALAGAAYLWRPKRSARPRREEALAEAARAAREDGEAARVDALLERIHAEGISALTDEERAFLKRVSSRYRR